MPLAAAAVQRRTLSIAAISASIVKGTALQLQLRVPPLVLLILLLTLSSDGQL
jgi:hypothetical protein